MNQITGFLKAHFLPLIIFVLIAIIYMYPNLSGKQISQSDVIQHKGGAKEIIDFREKTGKEPLWTNSMFGGMPAYLISVKDKSNLVQNLQYLLYRKDYRPLYFIFLYLIGFYISLWAFGIKAWLRVIGAIAYAFSSYFFIIIIAGHNSKVLALGYMPPIIAGAYMAYRGKYLWGGILLGIFLSLELFTNNLQIAYYTLLILLILGIVEFVNAVKEKQYKTFLTATGILIIAGILAVLSNITNIWTTYEYSKYSIRGKSDLTFNESNQTSGLDKDYATEWSYGIDETLTLMIPNFKGGESYGSLPEKSKTFEFLKKVQSPRDARRTIRQVPTYWGEQRSTAGPVYVGAVVIFLFILSLFIIRGKIKWWLVSVVIASILLSWGRNFSFLTNLFLDYFPVYNKFRTVSMILIMAEFAIPLMAILGLNTIINGKIEKKDLAKPILRSLYITGGICIFFILLAGAFYHFEAELDKEYIAQGAKEFVSALQADRLMLLRRDAFRSLIFILLAAGILWYYTKDKLTKTYLIAGMGLLILIDMWAVDKRYLNNDDFILGKEFENPIPKTKADEFILTHGKADPDYRVLTLSNPFNNATTSFYHKSIGGYHAAKMRRYQELIDFQLMPELSSLIGALQTGKISVADSVLMLSGALNMLNTRYVIYNPGAMPLINNYALGHAWFIRELKFAGNADEEITMLGKIDPASIAIVDETFTAMLEGFEPQADSTARIELVSYSPNELKYTTSTNSEQLAVFSEIYYPKGWKVSIDGKKADYFRADFLLRAMLVPAGNHEVVFSFKPESFYTGNKIATASSGILLLLLIGAVFLEIKKSLGKNKE